MPAMSDTLEFNMARSEGFDGQFMRVVSALILAGVMVLLAHAAAFAAGGPGKVALVIGNADIPTATQS